MDLNDLILSFPCDRSILTRHARPNLASHAPIDRMRRVVKASVLASIREDTNLNMMIPSIINSRFSRAIRNLL